MLSWLCVFVIERIQIADELLCAQIGRNREVVYSGALAEVGAVRDPPVMFAANLELEASVNIESEDHGAIRQSWQSTAGWLLAAPLTTRTDKSDAERPCRC
jgi:hypothetical protein